MAVSLLAEFKSFMRIDSDDVEADGRYAHALARAQEDVEALLGYPLDSAAVTSEYHDANKVIVPNRLPVTTLTSVKYRFSYTDASQDMTLVEYTDYIQRKSMDGFTHWLEMLTYVTLQPLRIALAYTGGYASDYPGGIVSAIFYFAARELGVADLQEGENVPEARYIMAAKAKLTPYIRGTPR
jgi:hypothetical protein